MSSRLHAHARRRKSAAPRSFNAATGLTGTTEEELARRAEITAAALALTEAKDKARKTPTASRIRAPRLPSRRRDPGARPPRVFSLPPAPDPSPGTAAAASGGVPPRSPAVNAAVAAGPDTSAAAPGPAGSPGPPGEEEAQPVEAPREGPADRPKGALRSKLTAAVVATEAEVAKSTRAIKPGAGTTHGAGAGEAPVTEVRPPTAATTSVVPARTPSGDSRASAAQSPLSPSQPPKSVPIRREGSPTASTTIGPKAVRAPKGGSRWRRRPTTGAGEANRRPVDRTRPRSSPAREAKARRLAPPLRGPGKRLPGTTTKGQASPSDRKAPSKKKPAKQKTPATPEQRRRRIPVAVAAAFAVVVLATNFPLSSILSQHHQLSAARAQLAQVQSENQALAQQQHALDSNVAVSQMARGEYQMVSPGQTLYDVLPPSSKTATTVPGSTTNGDPGDQPLVAPSNAPDLSPQLGLPQPIPTSAAGSSAVTVGKRGGSAPSSERTAVPPSPSTFWGRVTDTLEFWK